MPCDFFLETERLYFRRFRAEDAQLLFELDSDPEVMRFITKGRPTPLAQIQNEIILRFLDYYILVPPQGFWAAHLRQTDDFIGWFHLRPNKTWPGEMELGYRLKRNVWGRGLATEGSRALLEEAFNAWNYEKVCAHSLAGNLASRRVMEKVGLVFECDFFYDANVFPERTNEEECRAVKYSISRTQFLEIF